MRGHVWRCRTWISRKFQIWVTTFVVWRILTSFIEHLLPTRHCNMTFHPRYYLHFVDEEIEMESLSKVFKVPEETVGLLIATVLFSFMHFSPLCLEPVTDTDLGTRRATNSSYRLLLLLPLGIYQKYSHWNGPWQPSLKAQKLTSKKVSAVQ